MPTIPDIGFGDFRATYPLAVAARKSCRAATVGVLFLTLFCAQVLAAQVLSPPPQMAPTAEALEMLHDCGKQISHTASGTSARIIDAQQQLFFGLLKGGYVNQSGGGGGYGRGHNGGYQRNSEWLLTPPPKDYVADLQHEGRWCLEVAQILNTDPSRKEDAQQVLASIANDLEIKMKDCKDWGAGRLVTVIADTVKNGQPDPGWTVMYKWVSVSGLNSMDLAFPQISTPTSKGVPPGVYSVYATKQVGSTVMKSTPVTVSAFQDQKVKCQIPVP